MKTALDTKWYIRAQDSIAQGALTNSKRAECFVKTIYPVHLTKGRGCYVWDTQGNRYIDFICGLGSNLLGYGNSLIAESMYRQALEGCTLSLSTTLEVVVAEKIKEVVPFVEKMKFLKTGTEACMAAIRIARAYHGVSRENQEMYEMFGNPSYRGLPQEWSEKEKSLQVLYNGLSTETRNQRNQKSGPAEIRTFSEGQTNREKALAKAMGAGQALGRDKIYYSCRRKLQRQPCEICQNPKSQAHHHDYTKPLEVTWLCQTHHSLAHREH